MKRMRALPFADIVSLACDDSIDGFSEFPTLVALIRPSATFSRWEKGSGRPRTGHHALPSD